VQTNPVFPLVFIFFESACSFRRENLVNYWHFHVAVRANPIFLTVSRHCLSRALDTMYFGEQNEDVFCKIATTKEERVMCIEQGFDLVDKDVDGSWYFRKRK
jgi:hypothetical protein